MQIKTMMKKQEWKNKRPSGKISQTKLEVKLGGAQKGDKEGSRMKVNNNKE
jgi:hypothetical protein